MGVDIQFFANHNIKGKTFVERLNHIEKRLQRDIHLIPNIPHNKENLPKKTNEIDEAIYFITNPKEEEIFNSSNEISIYTNFAYFSGMTIYNRTMKIYPDGLSTHSYKWKLYLGDEYEKKKKSTEFLEYNRNWEEFQKFKFQIISKLGGNKIIYIDDHSFQEPEDLFYQGKKLEEVLIELKKIGPLFKIEKLYNDFDEIFNDFDLKYYGFYEELK